MKKEIGREQEYVRDLHWYSRGNLFRLPVCALFKNRNKTEHHLLIFFLSSILTDEHLPFFILTFSHSSSIPQYYFFVT